MAETNTINNFLKTVLKKNIFTLICMFGSCIGIHIVYIAYYEKYSALFMKAIPVVMNTTRLEIFNIALMAIGSCFLMQFLNFLTFFFVSNALPSLNHEIKLKAFKEVQKNPLEFFHRNPDGEIEKHLSNLGDTIIQIIEGFLYFILPSIVPVLYVLKQAFHTNYKLFFGISGWLSIVLIVTIISMSKINKYSSKLSHLRSVQSGLMTDLFKNIIVEKIFMRQDRGIYYFNKYHSEDNREYSKLLINMGIQKSLIGFLSLFLMINIWLLIFSQKHVLGDKNSILLITMTKASVSKIWDMLLRIFPITQLFGKFKKSFHFIFYPKEEYINEKKIVKVPKSGVLKFNNINFQSYHGKVILQNCNCEFKPGFHVIDAPSGMGKTTILYLIVRLLETEGISFGGCPIDKFSKEEWLDKITFVSQSNMVYSSDIEDNIILGQEKNEVKFNEVCESVGIKDFVIGLPKKYQTKVGVGGGQLSGGQVQKVCIARALMKDKPGNIILLDEPLSNLDKASAKQIIEIINQIKENRIIICTDHSNQLLSMADYIWNFKNSSLQLV